MLSSLSSWTGTAAAADDDWPDPIDYPYLPKPPQPVNQPKQPKGESRLKSLWPFGKNKSKDGKSDKQPAPSEEQIVKVGPRQTLASPDPLLRLPLPIRSDMDIIPAGFYLVHLTAGSEDQPQDVMLIQKNKAILRFSVKPAGTPDDENRAETGTASPIKKIPQAIPSGLKAEVRLTPDQKGLIIVVRNDQQRFESGAFPVATDQRHELTY